MDNTIYIVKIDAAKLNHSESDYLFFKTTCSNIFYGKLVNNSGSNFYFELKDSNDLVIVPHNWIKWMAPSKLLKEKNNG